MTAIPADLNENNAVARAQGEFLAYKEKVAHHLGDLAHAVDVFVDKKGTVTLQHTDPKYDENISLDTPGIKANLGVDTWLPTHFTSVDQPDDEEFAVVRHVDGEGYIGADGKKLLAHIDALADKPL